MHGGTNPLARALGRGTRQFYRLARSGGKGQIAAVSVSLRIMARPASEYANDVTVYLVEEDFGRLGRAYLGTDAAEADRSPSTSITRSSALVHWWLTAKMVDGP